MVQYQRCGVTVRAMGDQTGSAGYRFRAGRRAWRCEPSAIVTAASMGGTTEMIDPRRFDDLARRIQASLPPGLDEVREDVSRNIRAVIAAGIARMDLVEREEFDVQCAVLARTREKVEALERRVHALEAQLSDTGEA